MVDRCQSNGVSPMLRKNTLWMKSTLNFIKDGHKSVNISFDGFLMSPTDRQNHNRGPSNRVVM